MQTMQPNAIGVKYEPKGVAISFTRNLVSPMRPGTHEAGEFGAIRTNSQWVEDGTKSECHPVIGRIGSIDLT